MLFLFDLELLTSVFWIKNDRLCLQTYYVLQLLASIDCTGHRRGYCKWPFSNFFFLDVGLRFELTQDLMIAR